LYQSLLSIPREEKSPSIEYLIYWWLSLLLLLHFFSFLKYIKKRRNKTNDQPKMIDSEWLIKMRERSLETAEEWNKHSKSLSSIRKNHSTSFQARSPHQVALSQFRRDASQTNSFDRSVKKAHTLTDTSYALTHAHTHAHTHHHSYICIYARTYKSRR